MNIQRPYKEPVIHGVAEILKERGIVVTLCGSWLNWDTYKVVQEEITCGKCLKGGRNGLEEDNHNLPTLQKENADRAASRI